MSYFLLSCELTVEESFERRALCLTVVFLMQGFRNRYLTLYVYYSDPKAGTCIKF